MEFTIMECNFKKKKFNDPNSLKMSSEKNFQRDISTKREKIYKEVFICYVNGKR